MSMPSPLSIIFLPITRFHRAFVRDTIRLYRVMNNSMRLRFWGIFLLYAALAAVEAVTILVIAFFGLSMSAPDVAKSNFFVQLLFAVSPALENSCSEPKMFIFTTCCMVTFFIIFKNILSCATLACTVYFCETLSIYIGKETLIRYFHKNYFWHISPESGDVLGRMGARGALGGMLVSLLQLYSYSMTSIALLSSLLLAEPKLTMVVVAVFSTIGTGSYYSLRKRMDKNGQTAATAGMSESSAITTSTRCIRDVIMFGNQEVFLKEIVRHMRAGLTPKAFLGVAGLIPSWALEIGGFLIIATSILTMAFSDISIPEMIASVSLLMLTAWRVLPSVSRSFSLAVSIVGMRSSGLMCLSLLEDFIQEDPETRPGPDPEFAFLESIELRKASFSYPNASFDALSDVSLVIKKGESVGLIGVSGAGKSTLALVLSGLVQPRNGEFLIDGRRPNEAQLAAYARMVGFVPQSPLLMAGTVADNVAFSQWGCGYDSARVEAACRMAAMDFICDSPSGINTPIGEGGSGLSGGQAQRVSIARALFIDPEVVIFDEATSALDQASESVIKDTVACLQGKTTAIIIAHRLTTVQACDKIIWIDNGGVREIGRPDEVLAKYTDYILKHKQTTSEHPHD